MTDEIKLEKPNHIFAVSSLCHDMPVLMGVFSSHKMASLARTVYIEEAREAARMDDYRIECLRLNAI